MMKKLLLILICFAAVGTESCKKFLEERSQSDIVPTTVKDFGDILQTGGYPHRSTKLQPQVLFMADDAEFYLPASGTDYAPLQLNHPAFQWQADFIEGCKLAGSPDELAFNSWKLYYGFLLNVNVVLNSLDKAIGKPEDRDWYKGQAFALRAYYYFMLVNLYALPYNDSTTTPDKSPGVPLKLDANVVEESIPRNTVAEVYAQIQRDLDSAFHHIEKDKRPRSNIFLDHVAAHFLASRVALYKEDWQGVISHADYVLAHHPILMDLANPGTTPLIGKTGVETIWAFGHAREVEVEGVLSLMDVSHNLAGTFDEKDLRTQNYFSVTPPELKPWVTPDYGLMKYPDLTDMLSWRSSEAYLNRAEAYIQLYRKNGDAAAAQKALNDLNALRAKRFNAGDVEPWIIKPGNELLAMCREERRRELFFEEAHRWFDLRRYGMPRIEHIYRPHPGITQKFVLNARDPQYVLPIPRDVVERNRGLLQNKQITGVRLPQ